MKSGQIEKKIRGSPDVFYTLKSSFVIFFIECELTQKRFPSPRAQSTASLSKRDKDWCPLQVETLLQGRRATDNTHGAQSSVTVPRPHAACQADAPRPGWKRPCRVGSGPLRSRPPSPSGAPAEWGVDTLKQSPFASHWFIEQGVGGFGILFHNRVTF